MDILKNPFRGIGIETPILAGIPAPSVNADGVQSLLKRCPDAAATPLIEAPEMAAALGVGRVSLKDERGRMGLGSFKALGAAYVIAHAAITQGEPQSGKTYVTASAGNHGMSVAAGAKAFGANAVVYIADTVPEAFAQKLAALDATVVRAGPNYQASMDAALAAANDNGWTLLSDSSWPGYHELPHRLMEGYNALMDEVGTQIPTPPTHIFLQAGVGGLAGACAAMARKLWGDAPIITVVEPQAAPALRACIKAGDFVATSGPDSCMGRLDCKEASLIALKGLSKDADYFALISEDEGIAGSQFCASHGWPASPSGAGGLSGALAKSDLSLPADADVLIILSEGPEV